MSWRRLERIATDKHSSLSQTFANYGRKFFMTLGLEPEESPEQSSAEGLLRKGHHLSGINLAYMLVRQPILRPLLYVFD